MGLLSRLFDNHGEEEDEFPLRVGKTYYNSQADAYFRVEQTDPHLVIMTDRTGKTTAPKELYQHKFETDIIRELNDDEILVEHDG